MKVMEALEDSLEFSATSPIRWGQVTLNCHIWNHEPLDILNYILLIYFASLSVQMCTCTLAEVHIYQRTTCGTWLSPSIMLFPRVILTPSGLEASTPTQWASYFANPHFLLLAGVVITTRDLTGAHGLLSFSKLQVLLFHLGHLNPALLAQTWLSEIMILMFLFCHLWSRVIDLLMTQWDTNALFTNKEQSGWCVDLGSMKGEEGEGSKVAAERNCPFVPMPSSLLWLLSPYWLALTGSYQLQRE